MKLLTLIVPFALLVCPAQAQERFTIERNVITKQTEIYTPRSPWPRYTIENNNNIPGRTEIYDRDRPGFPVMSCEYHPMLKTTECTSR